MARGRKKAPATRVEELREQAREVAGVSGEALKEFAETTGAAAKEFAGRAREAAKELVAEIERASKRVEASESRRGRRLLKVGVAVAVGTALLANEKVRNAISGAARRARGTSTPDVWRPEPAAGNGEVRETVAGEAGK
jgi:hypothetical protein